MHTRKLFLATLLGCTMLAGCDGSDDKAVVNPTPANPTAQDTFNAVVDTPKQDVQPTTKFEEMQKVLEAVRLQAEKDHKTALSLTLWKMEMYDYPAITAAWQSAVDARTLLTGLQPKIDKVPADIAAVQALPGLSADAVAKLQALAAQPSALKADVSAALTKIAKAVDDVDDLVNAYHDPSRDPETIAALADRMAAAPKALADVTKQAASAGFSQRLAALNETLEYLRPRADVPLTQFVNPFVGTSRNPDSSYSGNLNAGAQLPFGMVNFSPSMSMSGYNGSGGYNYYGSYDSIQYFAMTHLNGPGCTNQGAVAMLPKDSSDAIDEYGLDFSHSLDNERAEPGYYMVKFDNKIRAELTATTRTGMARITYANKDKAFLILDAKINDSYKSGTSPDFVDLTLDASNKTLSGKAMAAAFCNPYGGSWNQPVYFYAMFDKPLKPATETVNKVVNKAVALQFDLQGTDNTVQVKIGISSVSADNAKLNLLGDSKPGLTGENTDWSFDAIKQRASDTWNRRLNTIQVDLTKRDPAQLTDAQKTKLTLFYTALYRVFGGPTVYSDINGEYRSMAQAKTDGKWPPISSDGDTKYPIQSRATAKVLDYPFTKLDGSSGGYTTHYTSFSMWDTYRSQAQLLAMISPVEASEMMQSLAADAKQCGAFPHWVDGAEDNTPMAGDNALNVLAGSYMFGAPAISIWRALRVSSNRRLSILRAPAITRRALARWPITSSMAMYRIVVRPLLKQSRKIVRRPPCCRRCRPAFCTALALRKMILPSCLGVLQTGRIYSTIPRRRKN